MPRKKYIEADGVLFPDWLFHFSGSKKADVSSAAELVVEAAVEQGKDQAFQASTSPSDLPAKKTIILDRNSFSEFTFTGERIALIKRLKLAGFDVRICVGEDFITVDDDLTDIVQSLSGLGTFQQRYKEIGVAKDQSAVMQVGDIGDITDCLAKNSYPNFNCEGNDWQYRQRLVKPEENIVLRLRYLGEEELTEWLKKDENLLSITGMYSVSSDEIKAEIKINIHNCQHIDLILKRYVEYFNDKIPYETLVLMFRVFPPHTHQFLQDNFFDKVDKKDQFSNKFEDIKKWREKGVELGKSPVIGSDFSYQPGNQSKLINIGDAILMFPDLAPNIINLYSDFVVGDGNNFTIIKGNLERLLSSIPKDRKDIFELLIDRKIIGNKDNAFEVAKVLIENGHYDLLFKIQDKIAYGNALGLIALIPDDNVEIIKGLIGVIKNQILVSEDTDLFYALKELIVSLPEIFLPEIGDLIDLAKVKSRTLYVHLANIYDPSLEREYRFFCYLLNQDLLEQIKKPDFKTGLYDVLKDYYQQLTTQQFIDLVGEGFFDGFLHAHLHFKSFLRDFDSEVMVTELLDRLVKKYHYKDNKFQGFIRHFGNLRFLAEDALKFERYRQTDYQTVADNLAAKHVTHLHIANLNDQKAVDDALAQIKKLPDLVAVQIADVQDKDLFNQFLEAIKDRKIKHLTLPITCIHIVEVKEFSEEFCFEFKDYRAILGRLAIFPDPKKDQEQEEERVAVPESSKDIFIAKSGLNSQFGVENKDSGFDMLQAGEVLKGPMPLIRTGIIEFEHNPHKKDFDQRFKKAEKLESVEVKSLNLESINDDDDANYCQFSQSLKSGQRYRLLSISADNEFLGIVGDGSNIKIEQDEDGFFYATATQDCKIDYVLKSSPIKTYKDLTAENPIKKIIDEYKDPKEGYLDLANPNQEFPDINSFDSPEKLMEELFQKRAGSCRHRVLAVWNKLRNTTEIDRNNFRIVRINNNHLILEIKNQQGLWLQADLGGSDAPLNYSVGETYAGGEVKPEIPQENAARDLPKRAELDEDSSDSLRKEFESAETAQNTQPDHRFLDGNGNPAEVSDGLHNLAATDSRPQTDPKSSFVEQQNPIKKSKPQKKSINPNDFSVKSEMLKNLQKALEPQSKISSPEDLAAQTLEVDFKKILVAVPKSSVAEHSNFLIAKARELKRPVFYIDHFDKIDIGANKVLIDENGVPEMTKGGLLQKFLQADFDGQKPVIIIDWDQFNDRQKLTLNTLLDRERTICGVKISDQVQIISLSSQKIEDSSFLSRHNSFVKSEISNFSVPAPKPQTAEIRVIDLQGMTNWRRTLFGKIVLENGQMVWQKSQFVLDLKSGQNQFDIENLAPQQLRELRYEIEQGRAKGYLQYQGYKIDLPKDFVVEFNTGARFGFADYFDPNQISLAKNQKFPLQDSADLHLINAHIFDQLLYGKEVKDSKYVTLPGLLESSQGQTLKLFISSKEISTAQWYCLFYQASQQQVKLELYLAEGVSLPSGLKYQELAGFGLEDQDRDLQAIPQIFVTNQPKLLKIDPSADQEITFINIEDYSYQDLFGGIDYDLEDQIFRQFYKTTSPVLEQLKQGNKVVLRGQFSRELLWEMEKIITSKPPIAGIENLTLIIEEPKSANLSGQTYQPLSWLPETAYQIHKFDDAQKKSPVIFQEKVSADLVLTEDSESLSKQFIKDRKNIFIEAIENNAMLQMVGPSGVGKSRLIAAFEENRQDNQFRIYREMTNFESWAQPDSNAKVKILFIDESNIEDWHLTIFEQLKEGGNRRILYKGKIYDLTENHKVVFACNPKSYGGGRVDQKLFADGSVPQMHLVDFPVAYIYEQILKNGVYQGLDQDIKDKILEAEFKQHCQGLISDYQKANKSRDPRNHLTVRELQEQALMWAVNRHDEILLREKNAEKPSLELKTANFISTAATEQSETALLGLLNIRAKQKADLLDVSGSGLNGILLEGASGIGKSELIAATLSSHGLVPLSVKDETDQDGYYKIDASMAFEQKRAIIIKAFEQGQALWIDEINSCIDDGLEKVLNSVLTDQHPDIANFKAVPGFVLIASANHIDMAGRSAISPAIMHRILHPQMRDLSEYQQQDLQKIILHCFDGDEKLQLQLNQLIPERRRFIAQVVVADFASILTDPQNQSFNLRMLRENVLPEMLGVYIEKCQYISDQDLQEYYKKPDHKPSLSPLPSPRPSESSKLQKTVFVETTKLQSQTKYEQLWKTELQRKGRYLYQFELGASNSDKFSFVSDEIYNSDENRIDAVKSTIAAAIYDLITNNKKLFDSIERLVKASDSSTLGSLESIKTSADKDAIHKTILSYVVRSAKSAENGFGSVKNNLIDDKLLRELKNLSGKWQLCNQKFGLYTEYDPDNKIAVGMRSKRVIAQCVEVYDPDRAKIDYDRLGKLSSGFTH